jgi:hypothetical protein
MSTQEVVDQILSILAAGKMEPFVRHIRLPEVVAKLWGESLEEEPRPYVGTKDSCSVAVGALGTVLIGWH